MRVNKYVILKQVAGPQKHVHWYKDVNKMFYELKSVVSFIKLNFILLHLEI